MTETMFNALMMKLDRVIILLSMLQSQATEQSSTVSTIHDVEEMRAAVVTGCDKALTMPIISRFLSEEQKRLLQAQRDFWQSADALPLNQLYEAFSKEP